MGGIRAPGKAAAFAIAGLVAVGGCGNGDGEASDVVDSADAITAAVAWQADEQEPIVDEDGEAQLPVIFVVADDGATIGVGVQADVAAATVDWATVRFADDVADTFDPAVDGEPVRDDGVLLLIGPMNEPAPSVEIDVVRYTAAETGEAFRLEITARTHTDDTSNDSGEGHGVQAVVTAVTQP